MLMFVSTSPVILYLPIVWFTSCILPFPRQCDHSGLMFKKFFHSSSCESFPRLGKFDILIAGNVKIVFFLIVMPCKLVERYVQFGGMCSPSLLRSVTEAGNSTLLRNICVYHTTLHHIPEQFQSHNLPGFSCPCLWW